MAGIGTMSPEDDDVDGDRPGASDATSPTGIARGPLRIVVVGGGVAGVSAAGEAALQCRTSRSRLMFRDGDRELDGGAGGTGGGAMTIITLVTASPILKRTSVDGEDEDDDDRGSLPLGEIRLDPVGVESWLADVGSGGRDGGNDEDVRVEVIVGTVRGVDLIERTVRVFPHHDCADADVDGATRGREMPESAPLTLRYDRLCIAVGSSPVSPLPLDWTDEILTVRDTTSVTDLARVFFRRQRDPDADGNVIGKRRSTRNARRIVLFGNGAIALELAYALTEEQPGDSDDDDDAPIVTWIVRDKYVGHAMLDAGAAAFLMPELADRLLQPADDEDEDYFKEEQEGGRGGTFTGASAELRRDRIEVNGVDEPSRRRQVDDAIPGTALGPDWRVHWTNAAAREASSENGELGREDCSTATSFVSPPQSSNHPILHPLGEGRGGCPCCTPGRGTFVFPPPKGDDGGEEEGGPTGRDDGGTGGGERSSSRRRRRLDVRYETEIYAVRRRSDPTTWVPVGATSGGNNDGNTATAHAAVLVQRASRERVGPMSDRLELLLSDGTYMSADAIVSATGVSPRENVDAVLGDRGGGRNYGDRCVLARGVDGGLVVDNFMRCRICREKCSPPDGGGGDDDYDDDDDGIDDLGVYAAGDCADCSIFEGRPIASPGSDSDEDDDDDVSLWHQIRLWTQARAAGIYAGRCMVLGPRTVKDERGGSFACGFDTFRHVTEFLGHRVTLLGLFNGQKCLYPSSSPSWRGGGDDDDDVDGRSSSVDLLSGFVPNPSGGGLLSIGGNEWREFLQRGVVPKGGDFSSDAERSGEDFGLESSVVVGKDQPVVVGRMDLNSDIEVQTRLTAGVEYVKIILSHGRIVGAVVVGESDMGETIENLMLSRINVNALGFSLLDPDFDIGDIFD